MRRDMDVGPGKSCRIPDWRRGAGIAGIDEPAKAAGVPSAKGARFVLWNAGFETQRLLSLTNMGMSTQGPQWSWRDETSKLRSEPARGGVILPDADEHSPPGAGASKATCPSAPKQSTLFPGPPNPSGEMTRKTVHATSGILRKRLTQPPLFPRDYKSIQPLRVDDGMQFIMARFYSPLKKTSAGCLARPLTPRNCEDPTGPG